MRIWILYFNVLFSKGTLTEKILRSVLNISKVAFMGALLKLIIAAQSSWIVGPLIFVFIQNGKMWAKTVSLRTEKKSTETGAPLIYVSVGNWDNASQKPFCLELKKIFKWNRRTLLLKRVRVLKEFYKKNQNLDIFSETWKKYEFNF